MYTGCAFVRDWESGILEMNRASFFAETLVAQYGISAKKIIPGSPGVDLGLGGRASQGVMRSFHSTEPW